MSHGRYGCGLERKLAMGGLKEKEESCMLFYSKRMTFLLYMQKVIFLQTN